MAVKDMEPKIDLQNKDTRPWLNEDLIKDIESVLHIENKKELLNKWIIIPEYQGTNYRFYCAIKKDTVFNVQETQFYDSELLARQAASFEKLKIVMVVSVEELVEWIMDKVSSEVVSLQGQIDWLNALSEGEF